VCEVYVNKSVYGTWTSRRIYEGKCGYYLQLQMFAKVRIKVILNMMFV